MAIDLWVWLKILRAIDLAPLFLKSWICHCVQYYYAMKQLRFFLESRFIAICSVHILLLQFCCSLDSEELLSTISASYFRLSWVSPDLTHLVVSTYDNNLLFINLPEYFQVHVHVCYMCVIRVHVHACICI